MQEEATLLKNICPCAFFLFVHSSFPKLLAYALSFEVNGLCDKITWTLHYKQILETNFNVKK